MSLVAAMESEFDISMDTSEAESITSFSMAHIILNEKGL
jgi:acyl carrier protein